MIRSMVQKIDVNIQVNLDEEEILISKALICLENRLRYKATQHLNSSKEVRAYAKLQLAQEQNEVFAVLFLNTHNRLIAFEKLFFGTINQAVVYPRMIVKKALQHNAAKLILAHNHPSQNCEPSNSDIEVTRDIKKILDIVDVKLIDHIVITHQETYSFAEHRLL
jgi:DNA repair protein RadC